MGSLKFKGDLNIAKGKLKQKWARLTGDNFQLIEGKQDEAMGRIQKRTAATRDAVVKASKKSHLQEDASAKDKHGTAAAPNHSKPS